jgi:hypothetical protein
MPDASGSVVVEVVLPNSPPWSAAWPASEAGSELATLRVDEDGMLRVTAQVVTPRGGPAGGDGRGHDRRCPGRSPGLGDLAARPAYRRCRIAAERFTLLRRSKLSSMHLLQNRCAGLWRDDPARNVLARAHVRGHSSVG